MALIFHEMGRNSAGTEAGASVDVFLRDGLKSKKILREEGKLPSIENPYDRAIAQSLARKEAALTRREQWRAERTEALKDNPELLQSILSSDQESTWWRPDDGVSGHDIFYKTDHPANREENVFFGFSGESPPAYAGGFTLIQAPLGHNLPALGFLCSA